MKESSAYSVLVVPSRDAVRIFSRPCSTPDI